MYLSEPLDPSTCPDLPSDVAIKIGCDKRELYPGEYSLETAADIFQSQKECLRTIERAGGHPLVVKGYLDALPEVPDTLVTDAACTDLKELQRVCCSRFGFCENDGPADWHTHAAFRQWVQ